MNMKKTLLVILTGITLASPVAGAATCRAGAAAEAGSKAAWEALRTSASLFRNSPVWTKSFAIWKTRSVMPSWIG
ncbi:hypothetical protein [Escherichia coli]|uniref:hypothetical protein n=1 Tax=Escherichia coli TaxID=562 RepID=UPI00202CF893|nr:hypothetical protein [Escherichia coli]